VNCMTTKEDEMKVMKVIRRLIPMKVISSSSGSAFANSFDIQLQK